MKKLILITGVILISYLLVIEAAAPGAGPDVAGTAQTQREDMQNGYLIGVSGERIAVYRDGEIVLQTDTLLSSLPKADRRRIEDGVKVNSEEELKSLLQDYCS